MGSTLALILLGGGEDAFVVRHAVMPHAPEDAQPLEGQGTHDGVVGLPWRFCFSRYSLAQVHLTVLRRANSCKVWCRNFGQAQRLLMIWVLPLCLRQGGDAGEDLEAAGIGPALLVGAKEGGQPGARVRPAPGRVSKMALEGWLA
jgi:hypothetical protein